MNKEIEKPENFIAPPNPYDLFKEWLSDAEDSEPNDANAMCLATSTLDGKPSARIVLLKALDKNGFVFYTNAESHKGQQIAQNKNAALCFHWKSLHKQVRIEGVVEEVTASEADAYYNTRHHRSRIGAWASKQSRPLQSYEELKKMVDDFDAKFAGEENIPRPDYWKGFRVKPKTIEFWIDGEYRLHQRYLYTQDASKNWTIGLLYP